MKQRFTSAVAKHTNTTSVRPNRQTTWWSRFAFAAVCGSALLLAGFYNEGGVAQAQSVAKPQFDRIAKGLDEALGGAGIKVVSIERVEFIDGLYEVVLVQNNSKKIVYTNGSGSHLIDGRLFDTKAMVNITGAKLDKLNAINFEKDLPLQHAFKTVYGTGSRKIAVFEDPNCGYCKRFRRETLVKLQDTTVYTFVLPILGKDSLEKAQRVFCADNKSKVWDEWMLNNEQPLGAGNCNTPINELLALGRSMNISGTPTVFFQDGTRADGAILPSELHRRIALAARSK